MSTRNRSYFSDCRCFFVTTSCYLHHHLLHFESCRRIVGASIVFVCRKYQADVLGYVLMPNHVHFVIYFKNENRLSVFMRDFKKFTSVQIRNEIARLAPRFLGELEYQYRDQLFKVWNDRFHDQCIKSRRHVRKALSYIHNNPLQEHWRLVEHPTEYPYSSASYYSSFAQGIVPVRHYRCYF